MLKDTNIRKSILCLAAMAVIGSLFVVICLAVFGNTDQIYTDLVLEMAAIFGSNKSMEMTLLYFLIFAGLIFYAVFHLWIGKRQSRDLDVKKTVFEKPDYNKHVLCVVCALAGIYYVLYSDMNQLLVYSFVCLVILYLTDQKLMIPGLYFFYMAAYGLAAVYRIYAWAGGDQRLNGSLTSFGALILTVFCLLYRKKSALYLKGCMGIQVIVPFLLLVFMQTKYRYGMETVIVDIPGAVKVFVCVFILLMVAEAVCVCIKHWNGSGDISQIISLGSCISIMIFNCFGGTGAVMSSDMHHPFENIIGFSQIFRLGQKAFEQYIPVSGMYSVVQGAIFEFFGRGHYSNYYITQNVFYAFIILCIILLLSMHLDRKMVFMIAVCFGITDYNRAAFILPVMLLLLIPKLVKSKNLWLKLWFITSYLQGLYYPVNGAAVCVAFLPLGIWQIITYIQSGELKKDIRKISFWMWWMVCMVPVVLGMPLLIGTYRHIHAMAGQGVMANGISRFGQLIPDYFMAYLSDYPAIRISLWSILTFMIPVFFVWAAFMAAMKISGIHLDGKRLKIINIKEGCIGLAAAIMPVIAYSYTFIRLDMNDLLSRSRGVLIAGAIMLIVYTFNYAADEKLRFAAVCFSAGIFAAAPNIGLSENDWKLAPYYTVPEGYVYTQNTEIEKLGIGFMEENLYQRIQSGWQRASDLDRDYAYFGAETEFGYYYLYGLKGASTIEAETVRGYAAARETIDNLRKNNSIAGAQLQPLYQYYLYHWLITSGEYVWDDKQRLFFPNEKQMEQEAVMNMNKDVNIAADEYSIGKTACSLGMSYDSLKAVFDDPGVDFTVEHDGNMAEVIFGEQVDGSLADFLYIELFHNSDNFQYTLFNLSGETEQTSTQLGRCLMKKNYNPGVDVIVRWQDDYGEVHSMRCALSKGKLLIPLGSGSKWLLHEHKSITISAEMNGEEIVLPDLLKIQLLKLREAG